LDSQQYLHNEASFNKRPDRNDKNNRSFHSQGGLSVIGSFDRPKKTFKDDFELFEGRASKGNNTMGRIKKESTE